MGLVLLKSKFLYSFIPSLTDRLFYSHVDDLQNGADPEEKKKGLLSKVKGFRNDLTNRVPQEHKDKANEHFTRGKQFLSEEYFPEERRDQFIFRGKKASSFYLSFVYFQLC